MVDSPKTGSKEFGELLRRARERRGMSRNDLVEATGPVVPVRLTAGDRLPHALPRRDSQARGCARDQPRRHLRRNVEALPRTTVGAEES